MTLSRLSSRPPGSAQYTPPGAFNNRITFYTPANAAAGVVESAYVESWAAVRGLQGREIDKAQQIGQSASLMVTVMYQPGIMASMIIGIIDRGTTRRLQILDIEDPDERQVELRIMCSEIGTNAGGSI